MSSDQQASHSANPAAKQAKTLSNRAFGLIFAGIFCVIALFPLLGKSDPRTWALIVAAAFALPALLLPQLLTPLNRGFNRFGQVMHKIINPLLMGLVFVLTVVPTGLIIRLLGKDPMNRKLDANAASYWIERDIPITKESFDNQF